MKGLFCGGKNTVYIVQERPLKSLKHVLETDVMFLAFSLQNHFCWLFQSKKKCTYGVYCGHIFL